MEGAALALWIVTAVGGLTMAGIWFAHRGPAQHAEGTSRISPARLGAHVGLAVTGLVLWIASVATGENGPGWVALALLPVVAGIGLLMFMTWLAGRGAVETGPTPAEQRIPPPLVVAHGVFAVLTLVAVLVALLT